MENICEWEKCKEMGEFKAPVEKDNSRKFKWLCKEHIKLFNKNWNYFEGMTQTQFEIFLKSDLTWHRPTQKFGSTDNFFNILWNNALSDKYKIFKEKSSRHVNTLRLSEKDKEAFKLMDLEFSADWTTVQKKFKTLVKKFHPDRNSGNKEFEDRLKKITMAYSHLRTIMMVK